MAAGIGGVAMITVGAFEERFFGRGSSRARIAVAMLAASAVFWLADRFGLMSAPYSANTLGLREAAPEDTGDIPRLALESTTHVVEYREQVADFLRRVMNLDPDQYFVSDESTIGDLHQDGDDRQYVRRTSEIYGVDISDIDPPRLWRVAERIHKTRKD